MNSNDRNHHRTTDRILDIVELIAEQPNQLTLSDISSHLNIPKSSLSPILYTLMDRRFIAIDNASKYTIGYSFYHIGNCFLQQFSFMDELDKILTSLSEVCLETSHFAILAGQDVLYLKKIDSPQSIRMVSVVGNKLPAYGTALGKALLMNFSEAELKKLYPNVLTPLTQNTITDFDILYAQIQNARLTGFTYEVEESNQYICCIAVPIYKGNTIVAAISVAIPIFRYDDEKEALIKALLTDAKHKVEAILVDIEDIDLASMSIN